jgi:diguanylate cyclase (GGDEF)-like protein
MDTGTHKGFTLRFTLSILVIIAVCLTAVVGVYSGIKANTNSLTSSYLVSNSDYAKKLASNTSELLDLMQQNVDALSKMRTDHPMSQKELDVWFHANHYFNSIFIVDENRNIQALSPAHTGVHVGEKLTSEASIRAIELKKSFISEPYTAHSGRLILLVSSPIFNENGTYAGFVGGTIYLQENNALNQLLKQHFFGNGSYVYVVDKNKHLIFHPDKERIYEAVPNNPVINKVLMGGNGSQSIINSEGNPFFAGYAYEPNSGWGIISQTPTSVLKKPLKNLFTYMFIVFVPLVVLILLVVWWFAYRIAKPLYTLAKFSEEAILHIKAVPSKLPKISSRIYEVKQLYQSINSHLNLLNTEIQMDGLTRLANRKAFDLVIREWHENKIPFSLILLDIDYFKRVNDSHGHVTGDEVLKFVASVMRTISREEDVCFRYGGEEFGILVKYGSSEAATDIAERIRERVETSMNPTGEVITISIGISFSDAKTLEDPKELIEMADQALYQSKKEGRNRTTIYSKT